MKKNILSYFIICFFIINILLLNSKILAENQPIGKLGSVIGKAEIIRNGKSITATKDILVFATDLLLTGEKAAVKIIFNDGGSFIAFEASKIKIEEYQLKSTDNGSTSVKSSFDIAKGKMRFFVKPQEKGKNDVTYKTANAVMGIRGTSGVISVSESGQTQLVVLTGKVEVKNPAQPNNIIFVNPNQMTDIVGTKAPTPAKYAPANLLNSINNDSQKIENTSSTTKDEPKKDEPKKDEPKKDEPKKDEPKQDEPKKDEPKQDEPKKDEPKRDEPKQDEPKKETITETKKDEPKQNEPKKDEPKQDEPKKETITETKKDEPKKINIKQESNSKTISNSDNKNINNTQQNTTSNNTQTTKNTDKTNSLNNNDLTLSNTNNNSTNTTKNLSPSTPILIQKTTVFSTEGSSSVTIKLPNIPIISPIIPDSKTITSPTTAITNNNKTTNNYPTQPNGQTNPIIQPVIITAPSVILPDISKQVNQTITQTNKIIEQQTNKVTENKAIENIKPVITKKQIIVIIPSIPPKK